MTDCGPREDKRGQGWPLWTPLDDPAAEVLRKRWLQNYPAALGGSDLCAESFLVRYDYQDWIGGTYPGVLMVTGPQEACAFLLYSALPDTLADGWCSVPEDFDLVGEAEERLSKEPAEQLKRLVETLWQAVQDAEVAAQDLDSIRDAVNSVFDFHSHPTGDRNWGHGFRLACWGSIADFLADPAIREDIEDWAEEEEEVPVYLAAQVESGDFDAERDADLEALSAFLESYGDSWC